MAQSPIKTSLHGAGRRRAYALRFISGKYQGGEFPIAAGKEINIGRSSDLEMVLVEDMVSRKHARIFWEGDSLAIEDFGSTNGTFVNGEKVKRSKLKEADRILIGTSILKVVALDAAASVAPPAKQDLEQVAARRHSSSVRTMSGAIDEIPLPDLLQLLSTSRKNGVLVVRNDDDFGKIFLRKGQIYYATVNDLAEVPPMKAIFRLLTWDKGLFDLEAPDETPFENELDLSVPELLMEGLRQIDEFAQLRGQLPDLRARIGLVAATTPKLSALSPDELDMLQVAHAAGTLEGALNQSPKTDLETGESLASLFKRGYLTVL